MLHATSLHSSGVKTPESADLFGTAEAVPSQEPFMRWLLVAEGKDDVDFGIDLDGSAVYEDRGVTPLTNGADRRFGK